MIIKFISLISLLLLSVIKKRFKSIFTRFQIFGFKLNYTECTIYSLNIFFSVWRIFQFYNLFFIFLIEKRRVNLIRCINIISLFYLYIFALFFKTDLKTIKMIFRLNLIGNISILKLIIPIDCSGHNFMSWKSILLRDLAIYTLQLCGFISIYFLYF